MEANRNKQDGVRLNVVLRPISCNLSDDKLLELYHSGRMFYVEEDEKEEVILMMRKAISRTLRLRHYIPDGRTTDDVCTYYKILFGGDESFEAVERMRDERTKKQFICEHVGILIEKGIIFGKTRNIAITLGFTSLNVDSAMRYIRRGRELWKSFHQIVGQSV